MFVYDESNTIIIEANIVQEQSLYEIPNYVKEIKDGNETYFVFKLFQQEAFNLSFAENSLITRIGDYAFYYCKYLQYIDFSNAKNLFEIGRFTFCHCESLVSLKFPSNLIKFTGYGAFKFCANLEFVEFPKKSSFESFSSGAFGHTKITNFCIPWKCYGIDGETFESCPINAFTVEEGNEYYEVYNNSLYKKGLTELISYARNISFSIPAQTIGIRDLAFYGYVFPMICPKQVTKISDWAFLGYQGTSLTICSPIKTIKRRMFGESPNLNEIQFLDKVDVIEDNAFSYSKRLKIVFFLYPVESISQTSFFSLSSICFYGSIESVKNALNSSKINECKIGLHLIQSCQFRGITKTIFLLYIIIIIQ